MKKTIAATMLVILFVGCFFISIDKMEEATAEENVYTVRVAKNIANGFIPKSDLDFEISESRLKTYIKLCWWEAQYLDSKDILLAFDADAYTWIVKLEANDPIIQEIKDMVEEYGLKCSMPD